MIYLVDTNVLLRSIQQADPMRADARRAAATLTRQDQQLSIVAQNLIEFWAVATRPAVNNGLALSILREDTWQGRPVYLVGAKAGDLHSSQFWIDQTNLYFVRMLRPAGKDGAQTQETQFNKYQHLGGGWMAPEVIFKVADRIVTTEEYSEMRAHPPLDSKLFDPQYWTSVHWRE